MALSSFNPRFYPVKSFLLAEEGENGTVMSPLDSEALFKGSVFVLVKLKDREEVESGLFFPESDARWQSWVASLSPWCHRVVAFVSGSSSARAEDGGTPFSCSPGELQTKGQVLPTVPSCTADCRTISSLVMLVCDVLKLLERSLQLPVQKGSSLRKS